MEFTSYYATVLERTHAVTILLVLLRDGEMNKSILTSKITTNNQSIKSRVDELIRSVLISETVADKHPYPHSIDLTPLGREVAEHLQTIEELMQQRG